MKKLIIEAPSGLDPKYKLWAREAAGEMLSLFPEYKSSFQIEFDELCRHGQTEIDQAAFDRLPDDEFKRKFVRLSNGKYLVPYASEAWYLAQSSAENRANGIDAADMENTASLKPRECCTANRRISLFLCLEAIFSRLSTATALKG